MGKDKDFLKTHQTFFSFLYNFGSSANTNLSIYTKTMRIDSLYI